jgi:Fe-S cluster assembly ATPase SufC
MEAIAQLFKLPETKAQRDTFVAACVDEILSGMHNHLTIEAQLKNLEETIKAIRTDERVKMGVLVELNKYPEKTFNFGYAKFTKKDAVTYDYSNDSKWQQLKEQLKNHEAILKSLKEPLADIATGEIFQPAIKKSSETFSITFNK